MSQDSATPSPALRFLQDPKGQLSELQQRIRRDAQRADLRIFLFQAYCVLGLWAKAAAQLDVLEELDRESLPMVQTYREAIRCELLRADVFAGRISPLVLGEPPEWLAFLIEALRLLGTGEAERAAALRQQAFDLAPACAGRLNGEAFQWIADADARLGPVLEAVVNGKYYWMPFSKLSRIEIDAPADLRDFVWLPATLTLANGGTHVALIASRYPGSEGSPDVALQTGRATQWRDLGADTWAGFGQRMLATDVHEVALLDVRTIELTTAST